MNEVGSRLNMINQRMIKVNIFDEIANSKQRFKQHFSMESSVGHLMEVSRNLYFISIGIDEIINGLKNRMRFQFSLLHIAYFGIFTFFLDLFSFSNYFYGFLKLEFLPDYFRINMSVYAIGFTWILGAKIDMMLAEIKSNLEPYKVFYFLINNVKSEHKLSDLNYNRLAILSRIILIGVLDYGTPIMEIIAIGLVILIGILSSKLIWILSAIYFAPALVIACLNFSCWICSVFIHFSYYKLRFHQIHHKIKSIIPNGKCSSLSKTSQTQLINLIQEHKDISNQIHKLNLMIRRAAGGLAIFLITDRIIVLYLLINYNNNAFVVVMLLCQFLMLFIVGFAITFLCSRQIKSANQSYELVQSILCRFNIKLPLRLKAS